MLESKKEVTKRLYEAEELKQKKLLQKQEAEATLEPEREFKACKKECTENSKEKAESRSEGIDEDPTKGPEGMTERKIQEVQEVQVEAVSKDIPERMEQENPAANRDDSQGNSKELAAEVPVVRGVPLHRTNFQKTRVSLLSREFLGRQSSKVVTELQTN